MRYATIISVIVFVTCTCIFTGCGLKKETPAPTPVADTIYSGGTIITIDDAQPQVEALAVKDGKILAVGKLSDIIVYNGEITEVIDLDGKTLLPGFIDTHSRIADHLIFLGSPNLSPPPFGSVKSIDKIVSTLKTHISEKTIPPGKLVVGIGYDDSMLTEKRHPTRKELDTISTEHPVCIFHISGRIAACNSLALETMGFTGESSDPKGGVIVRDENGELTGVLEEQAVYSILPFIEKKKPAHKIKDLVKLQAYYTNAGVTTIQDGATHPESVSLLRRAAAQGKLQVDIVTYPHWEHFNKIVTPKVHVGAYVNHLKIGGVKIVVDGSSQGKTAYLSEPYYFPPAGQPMNYQGYPIISQEVLNKRVDNLYVKGYQMLIHCNGDAAADMMLKAYEKALKKHNPKKLRPVMVHSQIVRKEQVAEMAALEISPSFFISQTYYWGDWYRDSVLGPDRTDNITPLSWVKKQKMPYTIHSDTPVIPPDILHLIWSAVNRTTRSGKVIGKHHRASPMEALKAVTIMAAYQCFEEGIKGSLEPGKLADLVILSDNPLTVESDKIKDIRVLSTIKEGNVVWKRSES